ncbi:hypothetical protein [Modestobacter italicus]|uniref:hypothetical protein n=1 Tax=Modestobacter italicus (strain DSM 44449 / CECT 9708 / BC 501) TaxID=2732864 RepID=UPI001C96BA97|nr:hypothetical protein [Modestobacter italicus]
MSQDVEPVIQVRPRPRLREPWTALRVALVVVWLGLALTTVLTGQRAASLDDLRAAVDAGRVDEVRVSEGLEPRTVGFAVQSAVWRSGPVLRRTEVWVASPGVDVPQDERPLISGDLADELRAADRDLRVVPLVEASSSSEVLGWRLPAWVGMVLLADGLAVLFLLVGGPAPARATRWAWFWLSWPPVGNLALPLLSGPFPGLPAPRPGGRRLTGGWAFLLCGVLGIGFFGAR